MALPPIKLKVKMLPHIFISISNNFYIYYCLDSHNLSRFRFITPPSPIKGFVKQNYIPKNQFYDLGIIVNFFHFLSRNPIELFLFPVPLKNIRPLQYNTTTLYFQEATAMFTCIQLLFSTIRSVKHQTRLLCVRHIPSITNLVVLTSELLVKKSCPTKKSR